jgi:hypothetical protein
MCVSRKFGLGLAATALLITSVSPAAAGWGGGFGGGYGNAWGGGGWGHNRRHHDNDTGEILGGLVLGAILVGVLSSASKKSKQARQDRGDAYPTRDSQSRGSIATEDGAVDACAMAAEDRAGRSASVRDINAVNKNSDGWDVEGVVESRDSWRDRAGDRHKFTCSVRFGSVETVYVEDRTVAFNQ